MTSLIEHFALESVATDVAGVRRVRLISPGKGSSGFYTAEMLNQFVAEALPKGTLVYLDHTSAEDEAQRDGTRSIKDVAGKFVTDPIFEADAPEGAGSYTTIKFTKAVNSLLEDVGDAIGVSVEVHDGKKDAQGNITEMRYTPLNSLALVPVPGRDGRVFENFRATASESQEEEGLDMPLTQEEMKGIAEMARDLIVEALKPETTEPVEIDIAGIVEKVSDAKLPKMLKSAAIAAILEGVSVDDAIKTQTDLYEAIAKTVVPEGSDEVLNLSEREGADDKPKDENSRGASYLERVRKGGNK